MVNSRPRLTVSTRNAERTRQAVLKAAQDVISSQGASFTLDAVAARAGVSKGGLVHHFGSREALITAAADEAVLKFRATVTALVDLSENVPGKMLRAYVRALCGGSPEVTHYFSSSSTWSGILEIPAVARVMDADELWWEEQFSRDGLSSERILLVRRAAEGIAAACAFREVGDSVLASARERLLELATHGTFEDPL